jgi:hypothetical protein
MTAVYSEDFTTHPTSGTQDDDDDRDDEHAGENEAPIREADDQTEAPEEFEVDDEDELGHPEDDEEDDEEDEETDEE